MSRNLMGYTLVNSFAGLDLVETTDAVVPDFSACRSPSRARRRWAKGIQGRMKLKPSSYRAGRTLFVHPVLMQQIREQVADKAVSIAVDFMSQFIGSATGGKVGGASGGVVKPREPYLFGSDGPELFIPRRGVIRFNDDVM